MQCMTLDWGEEGGDARKGSIGTSDKNGTYIVVFLFCFFFFVCVCGHTCSIWKFLDQGWNSSYSCDLNHSCWQHQIFKPLPQAQDQTGISGVT